MAPNNFKELILPSAIEETERLESYLNKLQSWAHFNDDEYDNIRLAVNEAVTNAIIHGNKEDPAKKVRVSASLDAPMLKISVEDEGKGFNPEDLPDPTAEENLLKPSGRGLFFIKQYTDNLEFENHARKMIMYFVLGG